MRGMDTLSVDNFASMAANIRCWERICATLAECSGLRIGVGCSASAGIVATFGVFAIASLQTLVAPASVSSILVARRAPIINVCRVTVE